MFDAKAKARFWRKVSPAPSDACWLWHGARSSSGYGNVGRKVDGRAHTYLAHRVAYQLVKGPIPSELDIDHLCRNKLCVNPGHLEADTHCVHGHEYTPDNTLWVDHRTGRRAGQRKRYCRSCNNDRYDRREVS